MDSPICKKCLDELGKQQVIDEKVYDKMRIDDIMTDTKTGEFLSPEVDCNCWKEKF